MTERKAKTKNSDVRGVGHARLGGQTHLLFWFVIPAGNLLLVFLAYLRKAEDHSTNLDRAQEAHRQEDQRRYKLQHVVNGDPNQPEGQQEQPHHGVGDGCKQSQRPAKDEE